MFIERIIFVYLALQLFSNTFEGSGAQRHHLMEEVLAQPSHAYAVRGNIFSFLLPWEKIQESVRSVVEDGNLQNWPLSPAQVQHLVRVRLIRGPESILNKFKELAVRAFVLTRVSRILQTFMFENCNFFF